MNPPTCYARCYPILPITEGYYSRCEALLAWETLQAPDLHPHRSPPPSTSWSTWLKEKKDEFKSFVEVKAKEAVKSVCLSCLDYTHRESREREEGRWGEEGAEEGRQSRWHRGRAGHRRPSPASSCHVILKYKKNIFFCLSTLDILCLP